jgi:hypothetical protein
MAVPIPRMTTMERLETWWVDRPGDQRLLEDGLWDDDGSDVYNICCSDGVEVGLEET